MIKPNQNSESFIGRKSCLYYPSLPNNCQFLTLVVSPLNRFFVTNIIKTNKTQQKYTLKVLWSPEPLSERMLLAQRVVMDAPIHVFFVSRAYFKFWHYRICVILFDTTFVSDFEKKKKLLKLFKNEFWEVTILILLNLLSIINF